MSQLDAGASVAPRSPSFPTLPIKRSRTPREQGPVERPVEPPFPDYPQMTALQVIAMLPRLSPAELDEVYNYEFRHRDRNSVMQALRRHLKVWA